MAVVPSAPAKQQHQNDQQNQHVRSIFLPCDPRRDSCNLLLEHLFNLPDFLLDIAGDLLCLAFVCQIRVAGDLSYLCFHIALHFVKLALDLIRRARFHVFLHFLSGVRQERFWRESHLGTPCRYATAP